jgi:hypothetical protein
MCLFLCSQYVIFHTFYIEYIWLTYCMKISKTERKQIENEMIFRRINENVVSDLDNLDAMHTRNGDTDLVRNEDLTLAFKCECSDENCDERILLKLSQYIEIHKDRGSFIVQTGHQVDPIEKVKVEKKDYNVVVKNNTIPEPDGPLNATPINNA